YRLEDRVNLKIDLSDRHPRQLRANPAADTGDVTQLRARVTADGRGWINPKADQQVAGPLPGQQTEIDRPGDLHSVRLIQRRVEAPHEIKADRYRDNQAAHHLSGQGAPVEGGHTCFELVHFVAQLACTGCIS